MQELTQIMASLSIASPASATTDRTIKTTQLSIKQLNELLGKSTQDFVKLFINNLTFIDSQEKSQVRELLEKRRVSTLQNLRSALQGKVSSLAPSHTILKKELSNDKSNICKDIMELTPLSYISQKSTPSDVDTNLLSLAQTTEEVTIIDASVATVPGCSNCVKSANPTRVAELEQKVATLEQEVATYKQILALAAGSPGCSNTCNTDLLEQKIAALDQRCSVIEQWTIPSLLPKESELNKLLKPMTTLTLATKLSQITGDGKDKNSVVVTPAKAKPPVPAPRTKSLPSPTQEPASTPNNGPLPKVPQTVKRAYLYIANFEPSCTRNLLRAHINNSTGSNLALSDIVELNTKSRVRAFKVAVPESKKDIVLSIWEAGIKAELYRSRKPAGHQRSSFQGLKAYTSNKSSENNPHQRRPNHKRPQQTHRQSRKQTHMQPRNQPYRMDSYQMGDYRDRRPYQYLKYQDQCPIQYYDYRGESSYQQPEQRSYSQYYNAYPY